MERGGQVQRDDRIPLFDREIFHRCNMLHTGIVHEDVDPARFLHHRFDLRYVGQVGSAVSCAQLVAQFRDLAIVPEAVEYDACAFGCERPCDREADAAGRPGDECALTIEKHLNLRPL